MTLTEKQTQTLITTIKSFISLSEQAIKDDPKMPRLNAEIGLPGLYNALNILTGSNFPIDE
jgi:hypothetical protein